MLRVFLWGRVCPSSNPITQSRQPVNIENRQKSYPSNQPVHIETSNSFTSTRGYRSQRLDVNGVPVNKVPLEDASAPPQKSMFGFLRWIKLTFTLTRRGEGAFSDKKKTLGNAAFPRVCGGRNRTRTCDPIDVNDVLYQLSHAT